MGLLLLLLLPAWSQYFLLLETRALSLLSVAFRSDAPTTKVHGPPARALVNQ